MVLEFHFLCEIFKSASLSSRPLLLLLNEGSFQTRLSQHQAKGWFKHNSFKKLFYTYSNCSLTLPSADPDLLSGAVKYRHATDWMDLGKHHELMWIRIHELAFRITPSRLTCEGKKMLQLFLWFLRWAQHYFTGKMSSLCGHYSCIYCAVATAECLQLTADQMYLRHGRESCVEKGGQMLSFVQTD